MALMEIHSKICRRHGSPRLDAHGMRPVHFWAHASDFVMSRPFLMRLVWFAFE